MVESQAGLGVPEAGLVEWAGSQAESGAPEADWVELDGSQVGLGVPEAGLVELAEFEAGLGVPEAGLVELAEFEAGLGVPEAGWVEWAGFEAGRGDFQAEVFGQGGWAGWLDDSPVDQGDRVGRPVGQGDPAGWLDDCPVEWRGGCSRRGGSLVGRDDFQEHRGGLAARWRSGERLPGWDEVRRPRRAGPCSRCRTAGGFVRLRAGSESGWSWAEREGRGWLRSRRAAGER